MARYPMIRDIRNVLISAICVGVCVAAVAGVEEWTSSGPEGAAVWVMAVDPQAPETLYAGAQGVWKSTDGGGHWNESSEGIPPDRLRALAVDPVNHQTVYAGTDGSGVFKSTDGGGSWSAINTGLSGDRVFSLAVHPTTPATVFAGLIHGGVHRSLDGGATWAALTNGISANQSVIDLVIDASAPETVYAGTYDGLFKSIDGGETWDDVGGQLPNYGVQCVAIDPENPMTVYVGLERGGVYKTVDGGSNWQDASSGLTDLYIEAILIDPSNTTTLYAGTGSGGPFKSSDGGASWVAASDGMPSRSVYDLRMSPTDPATVIAGTYGAGVFISRDAAAHWEAANGGFLAAWTEALVTDPGVAGSVRVGGGNGVWASHDATVSWEPITGDLPNLSVEALAQDPNDGDVMYAGTWNGVFKTIDGGLNWIHRDAGLSSVNSEMVATDPILEDRVYLGVWDGLHLSDDGGETWRQPDTGPRDKRVLSMAFDPVQPSTMFVGAWGGVYRSDDRGATWTSSLDDERIWDIAIDPTATSTLYTCTYNGVFKSSDGGTSWTVASTGLTEQYCWALAVDPLDPETVFMGSGAGVFVSHDGAANWERFPGVDDLNVMDLAFDGSGTTLYAALRGGGVAAYTFSSGGSCSLQCSASGPATTTVGATVPFEGAAVATGCNLPPSFEWAFGDGNSADEQNPTHRYEDAGNYNWTMTATADDASCSSGDSVLVEEFPSTWFVPAVAHTPGAGGTAWRTDVTVVAWDLGPVTLDLDFVPYGAGAEEHREQVLSPGQTVEWHDILVNLFGFGAEAVAKGTVRIGTDAPVFITARTYNETPSGTYGQQIPALPGATSVAALASPWTKLVASGEVGVIPHLKNNADFRSNIGVQNIGKNAVEVSLTLYGANGGQLGSAVTHTVGVGRYWQQNDVFAAAGAGDSDLAYGLVEIVSPDGSAWFYGSVVDNATGDPTTVPAWGPVRGDALVAGVAHSPGAGGTTWRTDFAMVNLGGGQTDIDLEFAAYEAGGLVTFAEATLGTMASGEWRDVLVSLFAADPEDSAKGTLRIPNASMLCITARTYNQTAVGTYGQLMPALRSSEGFDRRERVIIPGLKKNPGFRSNVGALNLSPFPVAVRVTLFDGDGRQIGDPMVRSIGPSEYSQIDNVFGEAHAGNCDLGYARINILTAGASVWAYGSVIDNATGDPTTVSALGY